MERQADPRKRSLQEALVNLYLSVKVRNKDDVENYTKEQQTAEESALHGTDPFVIIEYVKSSIDILLNCQMEKAMQMAEAKREETNESSYNKGNDSPPQDLEKLTQGLEAEVRLHIRAEQQQRLRIESLEATVEENEKKVEKLKAKKKARAKIDLSSGRS